MHRSMHALYIYIDNCRAPWRLTAELLGQRLKFCINSSREHVAKGNRQLNRRSNRGLHRRWRAVHQLLPCTPCNVIHARNKGPFCYTKRGQKLRTRHADIFTIKVSMVLCWCNGKHSIQYKNNQVKMLAVLGSTIRHNDDEWEHEPMTHCVQTLDTLKAWMWPELSPYI